MIQQAIHQIMEHRNLSFEEAKTVMNEIMSGEATQAQMGGFLAGLRMKGETIDEITACATVMREKALKLNPDFDVIDIVGTGGDEAGTFNISTTTSFIVAAGGVPVAKHGNRSVSSKSGAADVLERLGVNLALTAEQSEKILNGTGMCFMFAQTYHSSMKYAAPVRKEMGVRTIFNILGPPLQSRRRHHAASRRLRQGFGGTAGKGAQQLRRQQRVGGLRRRRSRRGYRHRSHPRM